jgi:hypothetical protein
MPGAGRDPVIRPGRRAYPGPVCGEPTNASRRVVDANGARLRWLPGRLLNGGARGAAAVRVIFVGRVLGPVVVQMGTGATRPVDNVESIENRHQQSPATGSYALPTERWEWVILFSTRAPYSCS